MLNIATAKEHFFQVAANYWALNFMVSICTNQSEIRLRNDHPVISDKHLFSANEINEHSLDIGNGIQNSHSPTSQPRSSSRLFKMPHHCYTSLKRPQLQLETSGHLHSQQRWSGPLCWSRSWSSSSSNVIDFHICDFTFQLFNLIFHSIF
jgi:hypothetical protein